MTQAFLYKWTELSTGKWYIGSRTAKGCHINDGYVCSSKTVRPLIKGTPHNWERKILEISEPNIIRSLEVELLQFLDAKNDPMSYNKTNGDENFYPLPNHSEATRKKLSSVNQGKTLSKETRKKISLGNKGKKRGPFSEEHRKNLSLARQNRFFSEEHRKNLSLAGQKKYFSEEHRKNLSLAGQNRFFSKEHRKKLSLSKQNMSEETRKKMSLAAQKRWNKNDISQ